VPDDTTLIRWAGCIGPQSLELLNDRAVERAQQQRVTRGRKLRLDGVVVETNVDHPTDSRLLGDGVRVLSRLLRRAKRVLGDGAALPKEVFRSRIRSVRRLAQRIHRIARRRGQEAAEELKDVDERLVTVSEATRRQVELVRTALEKEAGDASKRLIQQFEHFAPLVDQAITQARRRVLQGEAVPAQEKLLNLFEPHTQLHVRQKPGKAVEFGRKLLLSEVEGGIVSHYQVLPESGTEHPYFEGSLRAHQERFGRAPQLLAADRGLSSARNESLAREAGVQRVILPRTGRVSAERRQVERSPVWRRAYRFRAGVEDRISVLRRKYSLERCLDHGERGMGRWTGWGLLAHNLSKIAQSVAAQAA
jgi:IS5 family transposase